MREGNGTGGGTRTGSTRGGTDLAGLVGEAGSTAGDAEPESSMYLKGITIVFILKLLTALSGDPQPTSWVKPQINDATRFISHEWKHLG